MNSKFNHKFFNTQVRLKSKRFKLSKTLILRALGLTPMRYIAISLGLLQPKSMEIKAMALYFECQENEFYC